MVDVALFGAAGYAGLELAKLLASHPGVRLACAASDTHAGKTLDELTGMPAHRAIAFVTTDAAKQAAATCAAALLAVPPDAATQIAGALGKQTKVVDLSHAFRAKPEVIYGLTSLFGHEVAAASLVANPGCYATAVITAAAPLVEHGLVTGDLVVSAGSGVTGAGRQAVEAMSLGEMYGEVRAYKVLRHQHVPEIELALSRVGQAGDFSGRVTMTTHLLPIARGIFATLTVRLARAATTAELVERYRAAYGDDPTVTLARSAEDVSLRRVVGTNQVVIGVESDGRTAIVTVAIDNLLKGAAGQAMENMNLMLGLPRTAGLDHLARHA
ncbi:MAG: N-acetyl-gamma-glutamyl-phosphate reductase [Deltaproteobacteria bacterium]|nr:N-acetyl-gamma-glutamyl-phosphate reductase [Deltaproteobacteria bacterium]